MGNEGMLEGIEMIFGIIALALVFAGLITISYVVYVKIYSDKYTRERYAFSCLLASGSLLSLGISNISSKKGVGDHLYRLVAEISGQNPSAAGSASITEQLAITALVFFGVHLIWKSYRDWDGLRSVEEVDRRRRNQPPSFISQSVGEAVRLIKGDPPREVYDKRKVSFLQAILQSPSHDVVWHEHAKQLFELWDGGAIFRPEAEGGWDERQRCWYGTDRHTKKALRFFLSFGTTNGRRHQRFCWTRSWSRSGTVHIIRCCSASSSGLFPCGL